MVLIVSIKEVFENQTIENRITFTSNQLHISFEAKYIIPLKYMVDEGSLKKIDSIGGDLDIFTATIKGKKCHIFNTWHFAAPRKKDLESFYTPIQEAYRKYIK